eukprot:COSAG03_NODE_4822_length_1421_cov_0.937216_2_plen_90_part_01
MPTSILQANCVLKQAFVVLNPILWIIATKLEHRAVAILISRPCASTDSIGVATMGANVLFARVWRWQGSLDVTLQVVHMIVRAHPAATSV